MVCGATVYWHSWEVGVPPHPDREADITVPVGALEGRTTVEQDRLIEPPGLAHCLYPLVRGASPSTSGFMVRRELATSLGGFVDRFIALYEDQTFKMKVYLHAPVFVSSEVYDRYRQHAASAIMASRGSDRRDRARLEFLTWLQAYLAHRDKSFPLLRLKVQRALIRYRLPRLRALWVRLKRRQVATARKGRSA